MSWATGVGYSLSGLPVPRLRQLRQAGAHVSIVLILNPGVDLGSYLRFIGPWSVMQARLPIRSRGAQRAFVMCSVLIILESYQVKKGPLAETSPMLNDISGVPGWSKVRRQQCNTCCSGCEV